MALHSPELNFVYLLYMEISQELISLPINACFLELFDMLDIQDTEIKEPLLCPQELQKTREEAGLLPWSTLKFSIFIPSQTEVPWVMNLDM